MFNLFRLCRKDEISFDIVAVCGNKVECCFDNVAGVDGALVLFVTHTGRARRSQYFGPGGEANIPLIILIVHSDCLYTTAN